MTHETIKSDNAKALEILQAANVKTIKEFINYSFMRNGSWIEEHPIATTFIKLISENSNDFTKDIASKVLELRFNPSEKQSWCLAYQITNNINVYIQALKDSDSNL